MSTEVTIIREFTGVDRWIGGPESGFCDPERLCEIETVINGVGSRLVLRPISRGKSHLAHAAAGKTAREFNGNPAVRELVLKTEQLAHILCRVPSQDKDPLVPFFTTADELRQTLETEQIHALHQATRDFERRLLQGGRP